MKAVVQRVIDASVTVNGALKGGINYGLLVYLGVARDDTPRDADWLAEKIANLRIFDDSEGKMNLSLIDIVNQDKSKVNEVIVNQHNEAVNEASVNHDLDEVNTIPNILSQKREGAKEDQKFMKSNKTSAPWRLGVNSSQYNLGVLAISQFTLLGDARKGRRPSWEKAAPPEKARELYLYFIEKMSAKVPCASGEFQAHMMVSYTNDGPVTILLDSGEAKTAL